MAGNVTLVLTRVGDSLLENAGATLRKAFVFISFAIKQ
jgi:hypothetical protein